MPADPLDREARLDGVLVEYLEAVEVGLSPDRRAILARNPDLYDELTDFFADHDTIDPITRPLRLAAQDRDVDQALADLDPSAIPEHLGRIGTYEVVDWLGMGGMGVVFQAFDPSLDRPVAIKVLAPQWSADPGARHRFTREARSAAAISHPHVVTIHAVGAWKGRPYLVMEYVPGPTVQQRLDESGPPPLVETLAIAVQVASALAAAHTHGLIHRDIKPANILLENDLARAKLTDFGLARAVDDARLTQDGTLAGTPQYMAPEQARGEPLDRRADLFSLGGVLYALCTGNPPFRGHSTPEVLRRVCDETPPSVRRLNPEVPDWLAAIIARLLAKRPADRFGSAAEVADLLGQHLARLRDPSLPPLRPTRLLHWRAVAVAGLSGLTAGIASYWHDLPVAAPTFPSPVVVATGPVAVDSALPDLAGTTHPPILTHPDTTKLAQAVNWNFTGGRHDPRGLRFAGTPGFESLIQPDARGLRLNVPPGLAATVGVETTGQIIGDFEISASFLNLASPSPPDGHGVGPELTIRLVDPVGTFAAIARHQGRRDGGSDHSLISGSVGPDGHPRILGRWLPASSSSGRFRLIRVGTRLHYLAADSDGPFQDLFQIEIGPGAVESVQITLDPGQAAAGGDIVFGHLSIQAERIKKLK